MTGPSAHASATLAQPPLVVHVVYRFDTGGLENGVVNLINHMAPEAYRHAVVAITEVVPGFASRIRRDDVRFVSLRKPAGHGAKTWPGLLGVLREMKPAIVHTRNLAALEMQPVAWWAGVPGRVHGEHGRDVEDLDGSSRKHQWIRRAFQPFVHRTIALSRDLQTYLEQRVGVDPSRISQIYNGVDARRFHPQPGGARAGLDGSPFNDEGLWVLGTVGRMQTVKDQTLLARAFVQALQDNPAGTRHWRLVMVGDGPLRGKAEAIVAAAGLRDRVWFAGERADVPNVMRSLSCFVLPSLAEGISNTILEAMASGLPVVATQVGGNAELVRHGVTGLVVPSANVQAMAAALGRAASEAAAAGWGSVGRAEVERLFSLDAMVSAYQGVYDSLLAGRDLRPTH